MDIIKKILSFILIGFSIIGIIVAISFQFGLNWFDIESRDFVFSWMSEGGASNLPIFYGMSAIAGAILLATIESKKIK